MSYKAFYSLRLAGSRKQIGSEYSKSEREWKAHIISLQAALFWQEVSWLIYK